MLCLRGHLLQFGGGRIRAMSLAQVFCALRRSLRGFAGRVEGHGRPAGSIGAAGGADQVAATLQ